MVEADDCNKGCQNSATSLRAGFCQGDPLGEPSPSATLVTLHGTFTLQTRHLFMATYIERLLEEGDDDAMRWMMAEYDDSRIIEVVKGSRRLSLKTVRLWQDYYGLPEEEIRCLKTYCQKPGWPY